MIIEYESMKAAARIIIWTLVLIPTLATTVFSSDLIVTPASLSTYAGQTNIVLQATGNVEFSGGSMGLAALPNAGQLTVLAGNNIIFDSGTSLNVGNNWNVNLVAGTSFVPTVGQPTPPSGSDGIYLDGNAFIQGNNGNLNLMSTNEVQVGWSGSSNGAANTGLASITTTAGGNISVTTQYGDINTGSKPQGNVYRSTPPYYTVSTTLGGISTVAGGNLTIAAGGNVISNLPNGTETDDAGSGAFGSNPGNVTITASGNVFGHYVLANGVGTITAGNNIDVQSGADSFALSLITGTWNVNAPNGSIYLQEVRNPNRVFNAVGSSSGAGYHGFNYNPQAAVVLTAGDAVLTGLDVPRPNGNAIPVLYPPTLNVTAGSGGVTLQGNVTLFPSANQNLSIVITGGGSLLASPSSVTSPYMLYMSDSSQSRWLNSSTFGVSDHGSVPNNLNNANPVVLNISGSMENLNLITSEATQITVGGNMMNCGFSGQNLNPTNVSSITVAGQIYNQSAYSFVTLTSVIPSLPATDLPTGYTNSWSSIFTLALNPSTIANLPVPTGISSSQWAAYAMQNAALFPSGNPGFIYNPAAGQLGFAGPMSSLVLSYLTQPITVLRVDTNGLPVVANGYFVTDTVAWVASSQIQSLYAASQGDPSPSSGQLGYRIGGPGQFDVSASSISLGNTYGILSCDVEDPQGGFGGYANLALITPSGATLNVTVSSNLDMETSTIAAIGGGDVNVISTGGSIDLGLQEMFNTPRQVGFGVFTSGNGNVNVTALGDIDVNGSRIATYNGGNVFVESLQGNVNAGSGGSAINGVVVSYVNPGNEAAGYYTEEVYGSGIVAYTLENPSQVPGSASVPGNITIETPQGNI